MSIKKTLFKNTFFNLTGYVYLLLASFFSISIMLSNMGKDLFGVYIFLAGFIPLASVFDMGLSIALIREMASEKDPQSLAKTWRTGLFIFFVQALSLALIFFLLLLYLFEKLPLFATLLPDGHIKIALVLSLTVFMNHINNAYLSIPQALQRFDVYNSKSYLVGTANTLLTAWLTLKTINLTNIFLLQLIFHLITFAYIFLYAKKVFGQDAFKPTIFKDKQKSLTNFGLKNFIGTLAGQVEAQISKFFLGFLSTAQSITAFNIPQNLVMKSAGLVSQVSQAFFPLSANLLSKEKILKLKKLYLSLQVLIFIGGLVTVYLVNSYGYLFLSWWLKDVQIVALAYPVLQVLSFYFVLLALTPLPTAMLQGLGLPQVPSFFAVLTTFLEAVLMWLLIPRFHELGAAYAYLITIAITSPAFLIYTSIVFRKQLKKILSPDEN